MRCPGRRRLYSPGTHMSPLFWWTYGFLSTDAPVPVFGALMLILSDRLPTRENSLWLLVPVAILHALQDHNDPNIIGCVAAMLYAVAVNHAGAIPDETPAGGSKAVVVPAERQLREGGYLRRMGNHPDHRRSNAGNRGYTSAEGGKRYSRCKQSAEPHRRRLRRESQRPHSPFSSDRPIDQPRGRGRDRDDALQAKIPHILFDVGHRHSKRAVLADPLRHPALRRRRIFPTPAPAA